MTVEGKIRVAQWATGSVGLNTMRAIIQHPAMELVAVKVYSPAKAGKDAGELCHLDHVGVTASYSIDDIISARPHCVVYTPESTSIDDVCRLLESGINIVSTRSDFFHPGMMDQSAREAVEAACERGSASIHSTGSSPGFITEALPIVFTSLARRLDFLGIEEYADCLAGCSEEMLVDLMGFGDTPEAFARRQNSEHRSFEYSLGLLADGFGTPIERFETTTEGAVCTKPVKLHRSTIPAGTIGAMRVAVTGFRHGKPYMRFRSNWYVTRDIDPDWELQIDGWRVTIEGDAPVEMNIRLPMPTETNLIASARYTAHRPVNAIPCVVAARPGIVTTLDLPQVIARLG